jgi:hypothetical protein
LKNNACGISKEVNSVESIVGLKILHLNKSYVKKNTHFVREAKAARNLLRWS